MTAIGIAYTIELNHKICSKMDKNSCKNERNAL